MSRRNYEIGPFLPGPRAAAPPALAPGRARPFRKPQFHGASTKAMVLFKILHRRAISCKKSHRKAFRKQNVHSPQKMQHHGAVSPENGEGSCTYGLKEEHSFPGLNPPEDEDLDLGVFEIIPEDDGQLLFNIIGLQCPPHELVMCRIFLHAKSCEKSDCVSLLKEIDCENRFIACSVEFPNVFYAYLNKNEVAKLKGSDGVYGVVMYEKGFIVRA